MKNLLLKHGEIYTQNEIIYNGDLLISNGKISSIGKNLSTNDAEVIDLKGKNSAWLYRHTYSRRCWT